MRFVFRSSAIESLAVSAGDHDKHSAAVQKVWVTTGITHRRVFCSGWAHALVRRYAAMQGSSSSLRGEIDKHEVILVVQIVLTALIDDPHQIVPGSSPIGKNPID